MDEVTAEITIQQVIVETPLRFRPKVTVGAKTDMGRVRENNEDKHEYFLASKDSEIAQKGHVFLVCDGMGGHEAGQIASELACRTFIDVYRNHPSEDPEAAARSGVAAANRFILDVARMIPSRKGMGTTLSGLMMIQDRAVIAQVGDSRVYLCRNGETKQMTIDHTWVEETVAAGTMSREDAEASPYRHVITRALGVEDTVMPDVFSVPTQAGDIWMICSDGTTNHVTNPRIGEILPSMGPSEAAWALVNEALVGGGSDNATVIVVHLHELEPVASVPETQ
ncbi:MAG: protein phosphatase 2C domain-containing protein [Armatimonadetes bacterium]|nr:protein phosphatase 2C domain-containing protein [Armatimonadota bacterium]